MTGKCIFCLQDKELTEEHIIPESIGGDLIITAVCKECNSTIGTDIDGKYINSLPVSLPRFAFNVPGKSGTIPNPFGRVGITADGVKVRLDDELKPHILPSVEEETTQNGDIAVKMIFDKEDEPHLSKEVLKKVRRVLKKKYTSMPDDKIEKRAQEILSAAHKQVSTNTSKPTIQYSFTIDLTAMRREYIKIAYEIAFYLFGYDYVTCSATASILRDAISNRQQQPVHGQIPLNPDYLGQFFPERDKHIVMVLNGTAYVRLFTMSALVQFEEKDARFMCGEDKARVFAFDFTNRTHTEEAFIERLGRMIPQQ